MFGKNTDLVSSYFLYSIISLSFKNKIIGCFSDNDSSFASGAGGREFESHRQ
jgi:hypothetical protein